LRNRIHYDTLHGKARETDPRGPYEGVQMVTTSWQPHRESVYATALRTVGIALVAGSALALGSRGRIGWPVAVVLVLWFSLGGHFVELWYLNWLRPRLPVARATLIAARLGTWFLGGLLVAFGMAMTARVLTGARPGDQPAWWIGGVVFIALESIVHLVLQLRGRPSVYNGRG
jgi:hypothetical protein